MQREHVSYRRESSRVMTKKTGRPDNSGTTHTAAAKRWHQLADRYAMLAEQRAAYETGRAPLLRMPVAQQPVQQKQ